MNLPQNVSLPMKSLMENYTHLVMGTGCTVPILHPAIPPSEYCLPALDVVHWYTQHPSRPTPPPLESAKHVSIIGQGNVSLDIARMLLSRPADLAKYDVPDPVLDLLSRSQVRKVSIVGRRGPFQAAFTAKEVREMMDLSEAAMTPLDDTVLEAPNTDITRQQSRIVSLLKKGSRNKPAEGLKSWSLDFFRSPIGLSPSSSTGSRFDLSLAHTVLDGDNRAVPTGQTSTLPTDLVITSLGHRSEPTSEWYDPSLGHVRNVAGRVIDESGNILKNVYTSGWAATGARGVLASTMLNAYALVETILADAKVASPTGSATDLALAKPVLSGSSSRLDELPAEVVDGLNDGSVMTHEDWKVIDEEEVRRGEESGGKERERMDWEEARAFVSARSTRR